MWFINFFQILSNERCIHKEFIFKEFIHCKWWFLKFNLIFYFCSPIFLNDILHYVICLVNNYAIFTLLHVNFEEFPWGCHMFKHQGMIFNSCITIIIQYDHRSFWSFLQWWRLILVSHTRIFQQVLFLELTLFTECIIPSGFLRLMDVLAIFYCTNTDIDMVIWYRLFMQCWLNSILKGIVYFQDKNNEAFCKINWCDNTKGAYDRHMWIWYSEVNSFNHGWCICKCYWL